MADHKDKDSYSAQKDKNLIGDHHKEKENESVADNKNKDLNNNATSKDSDVKESNRKEKDPYSERTDKFFTADTHHNKEKNFTRQNNLAVVIIKDVRDDRIESVKIKIFKFVFFLILKYGPKILSYNLYLEFQDYVA